MSKTKQSINASIACITLNDSNDVIFGNSVFKPKVLQYRQQNEELISTSKCMTIFSSFACDIRKVLPHPEMCFTFFFI